MAGIGLFRRLGNLWRGFLSLWLADIEKRHPEIAYENAIHSLVEKYTQLKTATAAIGRRREGLEDGLNRMLQELAQTEAKLDTAIETDQDDLALILIQKRNELAALKRQAGEVQARQQLAELKAKKAAQSGTPGRALKPPGQLPP